MSMQTLTRALVSIPLFIFASCGGDFVTLHSNNEPADDAGALRLVLDQPYFPGGPEPNWVRWKSSNHGVLPSAELPNARYVSIYVALDQDDVDAVGYIFWSET